VESDPDSNLEITTEQQQPHRCSLVSRYQQNMASSSDPSSSKPPSGPRISTKSATDPVLRNAIRYTISAKEYDTLHRFVISRSKLLKRNAPTVARVEKLVERPGRDEDYNAAAVRASLRVFLATAAGLKVWEIIKARLLGGSSDG
jgi:hypothetical protein